MKIDKKRHILKTISWRVVASFDTFLIAWMLTGQPFIGLSMSIFEVFTKMILYYYHERFWFKKIRLSRKRKSIGNITPQKTNITRHKRQDLLSQKSKVLWFSGLSGSGKSAIANEIEKLLHSNGFKTYMLDGDNIRLGLCSDLKFSKDDRNENIRRVSEVSRLMADSGLITITSFISPYESNREIAKEIIGDGDFIEIYVNTTLEKCIERDIKGLYKKAQNGEIKGMTGIDDPYDIPKNPDIIVNGNLDGEDNIKKCANQIFEYIKNKI